MVSRRVDRGAALLTGALYYYTGKPCKHGHVDRRHTASGSCNTCRAAQRAESRRKCKAHYNAKARERNRTPTGLLQRTYNSMRGRSRGRRGHPSAHCWLNCRVLPRGEFIKWGLEDADYQRLFAEWARADYPLRLTPSIDRIDSDGHYEHPNIRFLPQWLNSSRRLNV